MVSFGCFLFVINCFTGCVWGLGEVIPTDKNQKNVVLCFGSYYHFYKNEHQSGDFDQL